MRVPALVTLLVLVVFACGSATSTETTTTEAPVTTSTSMATTTPTTPEGTSTVADSTTPSAPPPLVEFAAGQVIGPEEIEVELGDTVEIRVLSDIDDELHVHGYDLVFDLEAGVPLDLTFVADIPGVFGVEVHTGHTHVFEIRVVG